jgi:hypothetical protein
MLTESPKDELVNHIPCENGDYILAYRSKENNIQLKEELYSQAGKLIDTTLHFYTSNGKNHLNVVFNSENNIRGTVIYEFDENEKRTQMSEFHNGRLLYKHLYEYQDSGNIIDKTYDSKGVLVKELEVEEWEKTEF